MGKNDWGPPLWDLIHSITYFFPLNPTEKDIIIYKNFFYNCVPNMILCIYCRANYNNKIKQHLIRLENRDTLINWLINIHNEVNIQLHSPIFTREQADKKYTYLNHKKLYKLLNIYTNNELNNPRFLQVYISILKFLAYILPCKKCKNFIINNFKNKSLRDSLFIIQTKLSNNLLGKSTCLPI